MANNYFDNLNSNMKNVKFAPSFMMRGNILKFVAPDGKIISKDGSLRLYRYMRISNIAEILNGTVRFDLPDRWNDPFEKLFYRNPITIGTKTYQVFCLCFVSDVNKGEESLWHTHGQIQNGIKKSLCDCVVRAAIDVQNLCKELSKAHPDMTFFLTQIDYSLSREQILHRWRTQKNKAYSSLDEFIKDMSLKRKAFSYEHEVRLFGVSEQPLKTENQFCLINIKNTKSIITSVTLPPLPISQNYDKQAYHKQLEAMALNLKNELQNVGYNRTITQSRLYDII